MREYRTGSPFADLDREFAREANRIDRMIVASQIVMIILAVVGVATFGLLIVIALVLCGVL